jgi:hypothetical protein
MNTNNKQPAHRLGGMRGVLVAILGGFVVLVSDCVQGNWTTQLTNTPPDGSGGSMAPDT